MALKKAESRSPAPSPPYALFLSYARDDEDEHLDRFFADLCKNVRIRLGRSRHDPIGFRDVDGIRTGDHWPEGLARALSTCQVFLPLYSPCYFNSEFCGKEWSAFRSRLETHLSPLSPLILPILWLPLGSRFEELPREIRNIQDSYAENTYRSEGLQYLLSLTEQKDNYKKFLFEFSKNIVSTIRSHVLPPADPPLRLEDFPNAFEVIVAPVTSPSPSTRPSRRSSRGVLRKAEETVFCERELVVKDDFLTLVERVCRLREPGAQIERIHGEELSGDYLRVSVQYGDIVRVYPVGAVEHGVSLEALLAFCSQIDCRYRQADSSVISYLVYGGDPAPEGLLSSATRRNVRLMSFVEYQGLIDFRNYLQKQKEKLENDRIYQPRLYVQQRLWIPDQSVEHDALEKINEWLDSRDGRFVLILGDFGTGKTFLLQELARRMGESSLGPIPILLQMRFLEKGCSLDALLAQHFVLEQMEDFSIPKFRYMLEQGRIALLFDGFDELALWVTYDRGTMEHFDTLMEAAQGGAKVVVTSRRQHFLSEKQILTKLGERVELISGNRIGILQPFNRDQIRSFLVGLCGTEVAADAKLNLIDYVKDLLGLSGNPRLLGFIAEIPEKDLREAGAGSGQITAATLYRLLLERWLIYEYDRALPKGAVSGLSVEDRWNAVTTLAVRLWQETERSVSLDDLKEDTAKAIQQIDKAFDPATATFQVGSGTLLVRDEEGTFSFLHQSILEWLIARAAAAEIQKADDCMLLAIRELSPLMIDFLVSLAGKERAIHWAEETLANSGAETSSKNALLLLTRLGKEVRPKTHLSGQNLRGQDFSGQYLSGSLLEGADLTAAKLVETRLKGARLKRAILRESDLTRADLSEADLSEADLSRARLLGADLRGARMDGAVFLRSKLVGALLSGSLQECDTFGAAIQAPNVVEVFLSFAAAACSAVWLADGEWIASAEGAVIRLWDIASGREIRQFQGHEGPVRDVAVSPDQGLLASGSDDCSVRLWDVGSGREIRLPLKGHTGPVQSVSFSPDGKLLASGSRDNSIRLWDPDSGREVRPPLKGHTGPVLSIAFSPEGKLLASGSQDNSVRLWDPGSGCEVGQPFKGHRKPVQIVVFSLDGKLLASGSQDNSVRLWDISSGSEIKRIPGHNAPVTGLAFSLDGKLLASGSHDNTIGLWYTVSGRENRRLRGHNSRVQSLSPFRGKTLASGSEDNSLRLWDTDSGREVRRLQGHNGCVRSLAFSPDGKTLATGSEDCLIRLWDVASGRQVQPPLRHNSRVWSVAFSHDGAWLASGSGDPIVRVWNSGSGAEIQLRQHSLAVQAVDFHPKGTYLASGSLDQTVRLWNTDFRHEIPLFVSHDSYVRCVAFSRDGSRFASGSGDKSARIWETGSIHGNRQLLGHGSPVLGVAFSPDGTLLATSSHADGLQLWDTGSWRKAQPLDEHKKGSGGVVFSPDGRTLASGSDDGSVRLWDTDSGREIPCLKGHDSMVLSVAFSPDGKLLASGSADNTVRLWNIATGRCIVILGHLPEGWVACAPDGRYKFGGHIAGGFWHAINLCRFEVGELDEWVPGLRLPDDASFFDLPSWSPA